MKGLLFSGKKRIQKGWMLLACLMFLQPVYAFYHPQPAIVNLRCEYLVHPLGVDEKNPRLSWNLNDGRRGAKQYAYQLLVSLDSNEIKNHKGFQWNTGKTISSQTLVRYQGKPLQPFTRYYWGVISWDKDGKMIPASAIAFFETGMMDAGNWKGSWIADGGSIDLKPAPYFRKTFDISKKVKSARLYIAAAGLFEAYLNGSKVGNHRLDPSYTRFDRRNLYVVHDVTNAIQKGKNALGVLLGNGWYNHQSVAVWNFHQAPWRARPSFCLDLRLQYDDGSIETISSGKDWKTDLSPVIFNSIYTAEHYDANKEQNGWSSPSFQDQHWKGVVIRSAPSKNIVAQAMHPIRNVEAIPAVSVVKKNDSTYVFDLGRNISGVSQLKVRGEKGTIIRLKHGERLLSSGLVDLSNIDVHYRPADTTDPFQTDIFILNGKGEESFMPHFNYKGFQYVEVTGSKPVQLEKESLTGYFMHSDVPVLGWLQTSNPTLNKIWSATNNSYLSNLFGYPTDCPQREKNGWTGDAHIAVETGLYNFDGITIYEKWVRDHMDEQQPNGVLPSIIPTGGWGYEWGNGPDWTSTIALIPWNVYLFYGDSKLLKDSYPNIKRYVDHITDKYPSGLTSWGLGDWVPVKSQSPVELTSSIYYFADVTILSKAARLFGYEKDAIKYQALAAAIKNAINDKYFKAGEGIYGSGTQTELSAPLYWGLVPGEYKNKVALNLARRVEKDSFHLDVGLLGTKTILNALSENGFADVAYKIAAQETYPSWGWWIKNGATTLYENWNIQAKNDISLNHIMFGEVGAWLYKGLAGIKPDSSQPGFKNILLEPNFVKELESVEANFNSPHGQVVSSWKKEGGNIRYTVVVPPNCTATLSLNQEKQNILYENGKQVDGSGGIRFRIKEGKRVYQLEAGNYQFQIR